MNLMKSLLAGALLIGGLTVQAQTQNTVNDNSNNTPRFGIKGGVNFANIAGDDFESTDSRTSFHVGALVEFPMADIFSLQVEALYSGQGAEADFRGSDGDKAELQLDYINVPVLAKFYVIPNLAIEVGPQFSFLVNDEFDFNPNSNNGDIDLEGTAFEARKFEVGGAAGLTLQTQSGIFATGRYIYGFKNIYDGVEARNSVFQLGVGYRF